MTAPPPGMRARTVTPQIGGGQNLATKFHATSCSKAVAEDFSKAQYFQLALVGSTATAAAVGALSRGD